MPDGEGRYVAGDALGLVAGGLAALITPAPDENTAALLWESVRAGRGLEGVLGVLTAKGFEGLPDMGVAFLGGGTARVLVRGVVTAALALEGGGNEVFTAAGSITWDERRVDGVTGVTLAAGASAGSVRLPIAGGVVLASSLFIGTVADLPGPEQPVSVSEPPVPEPPTPDLRAPEPPAPPVAELPAPETW